MTICKFCLNKTRLEKLPLVRLRSILFVRASSPLYRSTYLARSIIFFLNLTPAKPSVSIQLHSQPTSASNFRLTQATGNRISIPPQQQQKKNHLSDDDFPSLGGMPRDDHPSIGAGTTQQPKVQWTVISSVRSRTGNCRTVYSKSSY